MSCRAATPEDHLVLSEIYLQCKNAADWLPADSKVQADFLRDTQEERVFVIGEEGQPPQGFVAVWEPEAFIHHLFIHPSAQSHGLAPVLLEFLETQIPRPWQLKCTLGNRRALKFYLSHGWREVEKGHGMDGPYALLELT